MNNKPTIIDFRKVIEAAKPTKAELLLPGVNMEKVVYAVRTLHEKRDFRDVINAAFAGYRGQAKTDFRVHLRGSLGEGNRQITTPVPKVSSSDY